MASAHPSIGMARCELRVQQGNAATVIFKTYCLHGRLPRMDDRQHARDAMSWVLDWLAIPLSGESEVIQLDEADRLRRDLADRSRQDPTIGVAAANDAATTALHLFRLLVERDPQTAGGVVRELREQLGAA